MNPIFLYSKNCELCQYLANNINIDWFKYFIMIDVDKKDVRNKIINSKNIIVNEIVNDKIIVNKYEVPIVKEWIIKNILQLEQPSQQFNHSHQQINQQT